MSKRTIIKITSALLLALGVLSAFSLIPSLFSTVEILGQLTVSKEAMELMLYLLILGLVGVISLVLQFVAGFKGLKVAKGTDFPDNCKTYGIILLILQVITIVINVILVGLTPVQTFSSIAGILILILYTKSASDLII